MSTFSGVGYVFLDRDGVINRKLPEGQYVRQWADVEFLPGATEAIAFLNRSGRKVIVLTNQRSIALGLLSEEQLAEIHRQLQTHLASQGAHLDAIYHCPHDRNQCRCRKPEIGMIEDAFRDFPGATAANSILIGDSLSDIEAGRRAGMPTIFIAGDLEHRKPGAEKAMQLANAVAASLAEATSFLAD